MGKLTAVGVKNAKAGRHGDGGGLYLLVKPSGARSWMLRVQQDGKRRDIGLGSIAALTLAEAREKAAELRKHALNGRDPKQERDRERRPIPTFRDATSAAHQALSAGWSEKNGAAFLSTLEAHAFPTIGDLRVDTIEAPAVRDTLAAVWTSKPELARKLRMRIGQVLNFCHSKGWRQTEAPGRTVVVGLPRQPKGRNFRAMPYRDVPAFVAAMEMKGPSQGRRALLFQILTAARSGEVRAARWGQIDLDAKEWRRPADMMKAGVEHVVTLNGPAVTILNDLRAGRQLEPQDLIFAGAAGAPLSDMTLSKVLRDAKLPFDPHGFRSTFRDWAAETMPEVPDPVAEAALAHLVPDKVVRAYKRTTFIAMRRELLDRWGSFVVPKAPK